MINFENIKTVMKTDIWLQKKAGIPLKKNLSVYYRLYESIFHCDHKIPEDKIYTEKRFV
jgi:hypothetical protein